MAASFLQVRCKFLLLMLAVSILSVSCISSKPYPSGQELPQPTTAPVVRPPKVGQEWVYEIRNVFNQEVVDVVTERVIAVGQQVRIQRSGVKAGPLPDEIQEPWGLVLQDPRWSPPQKFQNPLPLWPEKLTVGRSPIRMYRPIPKTGKVTTINIHAKATPTGLLTEMITPIKIVAKMK